MIACVGGGSNFSGFSFPMLAKKIKGKIDTDFVAAEPVSVPSLSKGEYRYDFGDTAGLTPLLKMYTMGHEFMPSPIHAGGLRYHGMSPIVSALVRENIIEPMSVHQLECFEAGVLFAKTEGIIPAPETCHAVRAAIIEATRDLNEPKTILFNFSGHGLIDMASYDKFYSGQLQNFDYPEEALARSLANLPKI